ncbi:retention module-containing protein [Halioglobus maricola]|uniref:Retention module-containing protein n=1 Tax=Halioglobus maricola TaxID=2601894 RepID=A0A5P9NM64_9GAMM|nr:retention module-containing protein [Halioglobus maricola]QFU76901.1 retention module-containing protein [Halioglobus maricola]
MDGAQIAVVASLTGKAYARNVDGELRELAIGDVLFEGETVVTPDGGSVELTLNDGSLMVVDTPEMSLSADLVADTAAGPDESAVQDETIDAVLAALESGEDLGDILEATAAGPSGGGPAGAGHSFIRLGRVAESTEEFVGIGGTVASVDEAEVSQNEPPVDAIDDEATTDPGVPVVITVETNDIFAEGEDVISITQPDNGVAVLNGDDTVTYTPNDGFFGTDTFTYTATNPDGTQGDTAIVTVIVNPPAEPPVEPPLEPPIEVVLPEINIGDDVVIEGDTAQVVVSLDKPWDEPITVSFETADDTATVVGGDYDPETGTITFEPGVTELVILISTNQDNIKEGSEFFDVNLSDPVNATIGDGEGVVEIIDLYDEPTISITDDEVIEGATGTLIVSLSRAVEEEVTVDFVSADGTAIEVNGDYLGTSGTLTFAPGETELIINVITIDDTVDEPTEFMVVNLSNAENAQIADPQGQVIIRDNEVQEENDPPVAQNEEVTVDEAALATGSDPTSDAETVAGQLAATDPDGDPINYLAGVQVGTYGTLEISANGSYVYTLNNRFDTSPDADNGTQTEFGAEQFQFTVFDGNGGSDIGFVTINIIDDVPQAVVSDIGEGGEGGEGGGAPGLSLIVDESPEAQANPEDNVGDRQSSADFSVLFANDVDGSTGDTDDDVQFGADGPGSVAYSLSLASEGGDLPSDGSTGVASGVYAVDEAGGGPAPGEEIMLYDNGGVLEGRIGGGPGEPDSILYFTIAVDGASGEITLTQALDDGETALSIWHPDTGSDDEIVSLTGFGGGGQQEGEVEYQINLTQTVTDDDGDTDSATVDLTEIENFDAQSETFVGAFNFSDDGPAIELLDVEVPQLEVSDENLAINATAGFAGLFSKDYGADGEGSAAYALDVTDAASGLVDTATNENVVLSLENGEVVGRTAIGGDIVLVVSVDESTGDVTLDQQRAVRHPDENDVAGDSVTFADSDLITLSLTVTDADGDSVVSDEVGIANALIFDDGPVIDISGTDGDTVVLRTEDGKTIGDLSDTDSTQADFSDSFDIVSSDYGNDGPGTVAWTYSLALLVASGTASGLSSDGDGVNLFLIGGDIVGSTAALEGNVNEGNSVFTLSVDAVGVVTLTQFQELDHSLDQNANFPTDVRTLANDLVSLQATATITDGDDDTAAETVALDLGGNVTFADDGPSIELARVEGPPALEVDESDLTIDDSADYSFLFSSDYGADGAGDIAYALGINVGVTGLVDTLTGEAVVLSLNLGVVQGRTSGSDDLVFEVSVDDSGEVTLNQLRAVEHSDSDDPDDVTGFAADDLVTLTATITDEEGDWASASVDIAGTLSFRDDGPSLEARVANESQVILQTYDADTIGANSDSDSTTADFSGTFIASGDYGADGAGSMGWTYGLSLIVDEGTDSNLTSGEAAIKLYLADDGTVIGSTAATEGAINAGNTIFSLAVDGDGIVTLTQYQEIDHGVPQSANFETDTRALANDLVSLDGTYTVTDGDDDSVSEDHSVDLGGNVVFADDGPGIDIGDAVGNEGSDDVVEDNGAIGGDINLDSGADQPASFTIGTSAGSLTGPLSAAVFVVGVAQSATGEVSNGGDVLGELTVTTDGAGDATWSFTPADNDSEAPTFTFVATITDDDGDTVSDSHTINIIPDVGPSAGDPIFLSLDEDDLSPLGTDQSGPTEMSETVSFTAGTEAITDFAFSTDLTALIGDTDNAVGNEIVWETVSDTEIQGKIGGDTVVTLTLEDIPGSIAPGETDTVTVTMELSDNLDHEFADNLQTVLDLGEVNVVASEANPADYAQAAVNLEVVDDIPETVTENEAIAPVQTNLMLILDVSGSMGDASGVGELTRFQAEVEAAKDLIAAYDALGDVRVQITLFSTGASTPESQWMTLAQATAALDALSSPGGWTNYDAAIEAAFGLNFTSGTIGGNGADAWDFDGKLDGGQNVSYFFSDGEPNRDNGDNNNGNINGDEQDDLEAFLSANDITSYAIGMGSGVSSGSLAPIAYDGANDTQIDPIIVTSFSQLSDTILGTVPPISGNLTGDAGADDVLALAVTIEGHTVSYNVATDTFDDGGGLPDDDWSFDEDTNELVVTTDKDGVWTIEMDTGDFTYQADPASTGEDTLGYQITDGDGDTSAEPSSVVIDLDPDGQQNVLSKQQVRTFSADEDGQAATSANDVLFGTTGDDVFAWELADAGEPGSPGSDIVRDFSVDSTDTLDLRDLLVGEDGADLTSYLNVSYDGADTVIEVSTTGGFVGDDSDAAKVDQVITIEGMDLVGGDDVATAIQNMLASGQLITD